MLFYGGFAKTGFANMHETLGMEGKSTNPAAERTGMAVLVRNLTQGLILF
jgi:hypothetical protein